jgi:hypothetical protein
VKTSIKRALAAALAASSVIAGAVVTTPPAQAAQTVTNYGFKGWAYGTNVNTGPVGVKLGKTAYSWLGCTRLTGRSSVRSVAAVETQDTPKVLKVGAVDSATRTYRTSGGTRVGVRSTNTVANVVLGDPAGINITIKGLGTTANAYATKDGKLHAASTFSSVDISASLPDGPLDPLEQLLNQAGATLGDLVKQLAQATGSQIEIPGLGVIKLGVTWNRVRTLRADSAASALRVMLYGPDTLKNTDDDMLIDIGRSRAIISKDLPSGVMRGSTHAVDASLVNGLATVGPLGESPLWCEGTRGVVKTRDLIGANPLLAGVTNIGVGRNKIYGVQYASGYVKAWTETTLADVALGTGDASLQITGIRVRAIAILRRNGTVALRREGTIASITAGGDSYPVPAPGQALEIPGIAMIQTFVTVRRNRSIDVTGLRVTLLPGSPAESVVNVGFATAGVSRT